MQNIFVAIALTTVGWAIWVRRRSWRCRKDAALTLSVVLTGVGLALTVPQQTPGLGRALYSLTGVAHLRDYFGHLAFMSSVAAIIYAAVVRLVPDDLVRHVMVKKVERPNVAAAVLMLTALVTAPCLRHLPAGRKQQDFFNYHPGPHLATYWITFALIMIYQFWYAVRLLRVLRRDPRSHTTANLYIIAVGLGVAGILCMGAHFLLPHYVITPITWLAFCAPGTLSGVAAAFSWTHRQGDTTKPER